MMTFVFPFLSRYKRDENGHASIEFGLIGILLIMLTLGAFELARYVHTSHNLTRAMGMVTRLVGMGATNEQIEANIRERLLPDLRRTLTVTFSQPTIGNLAYVRVDAQVDLPLIIPNLRLLGGGDTMTVRSVQLVPPTPET
jgi:Flp pilus assembly protein TadG